MSPIVISFVIVFVHIKLSSAVDTHLFDAWCEHHGKKYSSVEEKDYRIRVFEDNLAFITEHNRLKNSTYSLSLNDFADLSHQEFKTSRLGLRVIPLNTSHSIRKSSLLLIRESGAAAEIPTSMDWRKKGAVTPVKNQASCRASWAFSATGAIEGINKIVTGSLVSLSEQELLECDKSYNYGCNGGLMDSAFQWVIDSHGISTDQNYPYEAKDSTCNEKLKSWPISIDGYAAIPANDEKQLLQTVAFQPVSADHGVLIVGYDSEKGVDYWIVKNSWGSKWGMDGYMQILRNSGKVGGVCGINTLASYPIKRSTPKKPNVFPSSNTASCDLLRYCVGGEKCCCSARFIICWDWICCRMADGVCCDGVRKCCPNGFACDKHGGCHKLHLYLYKIIMYGSVRLHQKLSWAWNHLLKGIERQKAGCYVETEPVH
ncbi:cathepsin L [Ranunculus cassubicifolius]